MSCENCVICFNEFEDELDDDEIVKTLCGHKFHYGCLSDWLDTKNNCPVCRRLQPSPEIRTDKINLFFYILDPLTGKYIDRFTDRGYFLEKRERNKRIRYLRTVRRSHYLRTLRV